MNGLTCVEDQYLMPHCIACRIECPWDNLDVDSSGYDERQAVCGVDGKTYRSACDINRMICKIGRSIAVAYPGPCRGMYFGCSLRESIKLIGMESLVAVGKCKLLPLPLLLLLLLLGSGSAILTTINKEPQFCI